MHDDEKVFIATNRFGYGASKSDLTHLQSNTPKQWLKAQLTSYKLPTNAFSSAKAITKVTDYNLKNRKSKQAKNKDEIAEELKKAKRAVTKKARNLAQQTAMASINTSQPLQARLLDFFSNHFSVSRQGFMMTALAPTMEREAIAPMLTHSFKDMLIAVTSHPAMLIYLNNEQSIGPNSPVGKKRKKRGLNENLAREILELHTLGVDADYTQDDVIELAKALTGWSIGRPHKDEPAGFYFRANTHEPGDRKVLGRSYKQPRLKQGYQQVEQILSDLALHPTTAKRICFKLAKHFVSDEPPQALVDAMTKVYLQTNGDIPSTVSAMVDNDLSWSRDAKKLKTPREFVLSSCRVCLQTKLRPSIFETLDMMGHGFFNAGSPAGYADDASAWSGAQALTTRIEWASHFSAQVKHKVASISSRALGSLLSERTNTIISRAESQSQALTLLLMSPEFQRR